MLPVNTVFDLLSQAAAFAELTLILHMNAGCDHMLPLPTALGQTTLSLGMIAGRHHSAPNRD